MILRRAVALQEKDGGGAGGGLTLDELRQVAAEVGVDPRYVTAAVESRARAVTGGRLLGGPTSLQHVQVLPGRTDPTHVQAIVDEIRRVAGQHGKVDALPDSVEWHSKDALGSSFVSVSNVGNETRIRAMANRAEGAILVYTLAGSTALLGGLIAAATLGAFGDAVGLAGVGTIVAGSIASGRWIWTRHVRKWDQRLRQLVATVADVVRSDEPSA